MLRKISSSCSCITERLSRVGRGTLCCRNPRVSSRLGRARSVIVGPLTLSLPRASTGLFAVLPRAPQPSGLLPPSTRCPGSVNPTKASIVDQRAFYRLPQTPSLSPAVGRRPIPETRIGPPYSPPIKGILSKLPSSWVPYAELVRIDKPTGSYYLFFPCLFSTLMAAPMAMPMAEPLSVVGYSLLFFSGAVIMRGAGCTINDLWDRNLDPYVTRTKLRPIARGAITPFQGLVFTGFQLLAGLGILLSFPLPCLFYGVPSLLFVASYPLAKRVTYYPQFVLGLTFSWGAIMGFPALGIDLIHDAAALTASSLLYTSNVAWTVFYDMIYAHMDIKDDAKAGIKSIALKHDADTKKVLTGLAFTQIGLLAAAGVASGAGPAFYIGSCAGGLATLGIMIKKVNLKSVKDCWWWFVNGCWITGGLVSLGLGADYVLRYVRRDEPRETLADPA